MPTAGMPRDFEGGMGDAQYVPLGTADAWMQVPVVCPKCGAHIAPSSSICPVCRTPISTALSVPTEDWVVPERTWSPKRVLAMLLAAAVIIVVLIVVVTL